MRSSRVIQVVSCHAEGEVGDVIVGGVAPPPGETVREQSHWIARDGNLRRFMLNEPRGGVFRHVNLLVPAKDPRAAFGWIIMEPEDTPMMSGSNSICVATVLLETGLVPMEEPQTHVVLEAPAGLVEVTADCRDGKAERITVRNVPAFAARQQVPLEIPGLGTLTVDTAWGGDSFVMVDAQKAGFSIKPGEARDLAETGIKITNAANEQIGFEHAGDAEWDHISFCLFATGIDRTAQGLETRHAVAIQPGKIDRSPTGTAVSARMAVLHARGEMTAGETLIARSIIDSEFRGRIVGTDQVGNIPAIIPEISGRAWITGTHQHMLDPDDPWPDGYKLSDTWPKIS